MNAFTRWALLLVGIVFLCLASCSGGSSSGDSAAVAESIYDPGASVGALGFDEASRIGLFIQNGDGVGIQAHDGDSVEPGVKNLSVQVSGDLATIDRVFVSDGGVYQVEALSQGDGRYTCSFNISAENLYQILLVQVIHTSGKASKEKIVLRTYSPIAEHEYVKNGVGLLIAQELLEDQKAEIADILDARIRDVFAYITEERPSLIVNLSYGDSDPSTADIVVNTLEPVSSTSYPGAVLSVSFTVRNVSLTALPLYNQNLVTTQANDLTIDTYLAVGNAGNGAPGYLVLDFLGSVRASFSHPFFLKNAVQNMIASEITRLNLRPIAIDLAGGKDSLIQALPDYLTINGTDVDMNNLVSRLQLDLKKYLFADAYGITGDTASGALALGLGLYVEEYDDIIWASSPGSTPPSQTDGEDVFSNLCESTVNIMFEAVRQKYDGLVTELSYGDSDPATADFVVNSLTLSDSGTVDVKYAQVNFTVKNVDLTAVSMFGLDLIHTTDNDLTIDARFSIQDTGSGSQNRVILDTLSVSDVRFAKIFAGILSVQTLIKQNMLDMEPVSFSTNEILEDIDLALDMADALYTEARYPSFPAVTPYFQSPGWDLGLTSAYNFRCALSQSSVNRLLEGLLEQESGWDVRELLRAVLGEEFAGFDSAHSDSEETIMWLTVPPALDLRTSMIRLLVPDVILQYRVSGIPQWEASIDLDLVITPAAGGNELNLYVTPLEGRNHFHIMRDNRGNLGLLDHSSLVEDVIGRLPKMLGGSEGDPLVSLDLRSWQPAVVLKQREDAARISAGGGWLYIDLAALTLDLAQFIDLLGE